MKKLLLTLAALPVMAGSYTLTTTAAQDTRLTRSMTRANRMTCAQYGLPASCTQTQARKAFCEKNAFGGISTCPGASAIDVYSDVPTFLQRETVRRVLDAQAAELDAESSAAFEAAKAAATKAQKDAACAALGLSAGCLP